LNFRVRGLLIVELSYSNIIYCIEILVKYKKSISIYYAVVLRETD
jgi:hypothetical protein